MPNRECDPYRDTTTSADEVAHEEPFADWPTTSSFDPMGEVAGYGRLAKGLTTVPAGARRRIGRAMVAIVLLGLLIPLGNSAANLLAP